ncbi:hypothetical protein ACIQB5_47770 [Streptomyces sp. NPDC088560]|uniref:hypothetical protein n=1 Tax=Streptomyces sp. NPDC088560 TaxID=3365868 RepID=UPI0038269EB6
MPPHEFEHAAAFQCVPDVDAREDLQLAARCGRTGDRGLEPTGHHGRLSSSRYDHAQDRWIAWQEWAAPQFSVTTERLLAAEQHTREHSSAERDKRWRQLHEQDPDRAPIDDARRLDTAQAE